MYDGKKTVTIHLNDHLILCQLEATVLGHTAGKFIIAVAFCFQYHFWDTVHSH